MHVWRRVFSSESIAAAACRFEGAISCMKDPINLPGWYLDITNVVPPHLNSEPDFF